MLALLAVLPFLLSATAAPTPLQKRYQSVQIVSGRDGKCLFAADKTSSGSPVSTVDCNSFGNTLWDISPGSGSIIVSGTSYALDAGENPGNNGKLKVFESYPGLYQQTWYLTDDNRIAITGGDQCLDEGDDGVQTYQCTTGNTNQVWTVQSKPGNPPVSASSDPAPSSTSSAGPSQTPTDPSRGYFIHPKNDTSKCVTIQGGYDGRGAEVAITGCFTDSTSVANWGAYQRWDVPAQGQQGLVKSKGQSGFCLDAGDNPSAGSGLKVWDCYEGLQQQDWTWGGEILSLNNGQVLHTDPNSGSSYQKPYNYDYELKLGPLDRYNEDLTQQFVLESA